MTADPAAERALRLLIVAVLAVSIDSRVISAVLPAMAEDFDVTVGRIGIIVTAYLLPYGLFQLIYGPLADRVGQLRVISIAAVAFALSDIACAIAPSLALLTLSRFLAGMTAAAIIPLTLSFIGQTVPYAERQPRLALVLIASALGQILSSAVGGIMADYLSWRAIFLADGLFGLVIAALMLQALRKVPPLPRHPQPVLAGYRVALRDRRHIGYFALILVEGALTNGSIVYFGAMLRERDDLSYRAIGLIIALFGVTSILTGRMMRRLVPRLGELRMIVIGGFLTALAYGVCVFQPALIVVPLAMLVLGAAWTIMHTTFQTRATEIAPAARSTGIALFAFSLFVGSAIGSQAMALGIDTRGYNTTIVMLALATALFTLVAARVALPWSQPERGAA